MPIFERNVMDMIQFTKTFASESRVVIGLACASLALLTCSCGKNGRQEVYPIEGQVFGANDLPAAGALVIFHPVEPLQGDVDKPRGYVDDNGSFTLTTYEKDDGAPAGEYIVTVEWRPKKTNPFEKEKGDRLQGRYSNAKTSPLRATVQKEPTKLKPFKLE
jgi:hypothetical protein